MTEALLNNIRQAGNNDFSPAKRNKAVNDSSDSFSKTMQEVNQRRQRSQKTVEKNNDTVKEKSSSSSNREFLAELKAILNKNDKEIPSELLSLLQGGSLSKQQKAMLEKLMLNLKNNNLDISDLKSLLAKNNDDQNVDNSEEIQIFIPEAKNENRELKFINAEELENLVSLLESEGQKLSQAENSKLKAEIDQLAEILSNSNFEAGEKLEQNLEQITGIENLQNKLTELASILKKSDFASENLAEISEQKEIKLPLLAQAVDSESLDFSDLSDTFISKNNSSLFAELSAQIKEMLEEETTKLNSQQQITDSDLGNTDISSLDSSTTLDLAFEGGGLENKNQNNFFDLDNSDLFFNFDIENQGTANNLNVENFNLDTENNANLARNADLKSQIVEQFRGEYSPETKEMQIQLKPDSLGKIDISLSFDNEQLTGKMLVESEVVRAQLENSLKGLKSDLLKQGINIEQFKIETAKNSPQQIEKQNNFAFNDQNAAFSDGETGQNQEYEQRRFFQGQYYVQRNNGSSNLNDDNLIMRQQEIINRAAFSNEKINLLA